MRITERLSSLVSAGLERAQENGALPAAGGVEVSIEKPQHAEHGDFACSLPLRLARAMRMPPLAIAEQIVAALPPSAEVARAWTARPGFINFALSEDWLRRQVEAILQAGDRYGNVALGAGRKVQVEFVSVNPTGPLHVGHARGAVIGSGLASVLEAAGYDVTREYYVNDAGNQQRVYNETLYARYMQAAGFDAPLPEPAYRGEYMGELAAEILRAEGDRFTRMPRREAIDALAPIALERTLATIREDLGLLGIEYDVWFSEKSLLESGRFDEAMKLLEERGYIVDRDGARWFASTQLGEDKDNVVIRGSGGPTYFGTDIAYHLDKFARRGFDRVIDVWGADHHGHVARMMAVMSALGIDPARLSIIINQIVSFKQGEDRLRFSKRKGVIVTLRELVDEVGPDACRYIFLSRSPESQMEFDMELATRQSLDNPVYYVQYAHARISSVLRMADERGIDPSDGDTALLRHPAELDLMRQLVSLPEVVHLAASRLEPRHLPYYAYELARVFQRYYEAKDEARILSGRAEDLPLTKARLKLVSAARIVLARVLTLMGMTTPERM